MSNKKTTTIAIDYKLWELAKANGIGIGKCAEEGIKVKLGILGGKDFLIKKIENKQMEMEYLKEKLQSLETMEASREEAQVSESARFEKAVEECLSLHTEEYGIGKDKISEISVKYDIEFELLLSEMESRENIRIENFHFEERETNIPTVVR